MILDGTVYSWQAKIPDKHMWLSVTFSYEDTVSLFDPVSGISRDDRAELGLSSVIEEFLNGCAGKTYIDKKKYVIHFASNEDYVRYKLIFD